MKIALGTVQFGLKYGIANTSGQVSTDEGRAILQCAKASGVDTLDTAIAYGNSEERLGKLGVNGWKVISKLPALPQDVADVGCWVSNQVRASLQHLKIERLDGLLLHRPTDLLGPSGRDYRDALKHVQARNEVAAIGYSIYSPDELPALCDFLQPDIVQAPFNLIDRRLLSSGWLNQLANCGVRVHTRSVFLQGLLLMNRSERPVWFDRWNSLFEQWNHSCAQGNPLTLALGYVLSFPQIERVVVGVDNVAQLQEVIEAANLAWAGQFPNVESKDLELIEPSRWKLA